LGIKHKHKPVQVQQALEQHQAFEAATRVSAVAPETSAGSLALATERLLLLLLLLDRHGCSTWCWNCTAGAGGAALAAAVSVLLAHAVCPLLGLLTVVKPTSS
jgi:hypothetical protein